MSGKTLLDDAVLLARDVVATDLSYSMVGCPGVEAPLLEAALRILKRNEESEPDAGEAPGPGPTTA